MEFNSTVLGRELASKQPCTEARSEAVRSHCPAPAGLARGTSCSALPYGPHVARAVGPEPPRLPSCPPCPGYNPTTPASFPRDSYLCKAAPEAQSQERRAMFDPSPGSFVRRRSNTMWGLAHSLSSIRTLTFPAGSKEGKGQEAQRERGVSAAQVTKGFANTQDQPAQKRTAATFLPQQQPER